MPRLNLNQPPGEALKTLIRRELSATAKRLAEARAGAKVHGARRSLKLTRSLLRLVRHAMGIAAFTETDRLLREAAGFLAGTRHAEALAEAIAKLPSGPRSELEAWSRAIPPPDHIVSDPTAAAEHLVRAARKRASKWSIARNDLAPLTRGMRACYAKARRTLRKGLVVSDSEVLHEARKSVIHHLHHVEILEAIWPAMFKAWRVELNALRLALGDLHDLDELEAAITASGDRTAGVSATIAARRAALIRTIGAGSAVLFAEKPAAFAARMEAMWRAAME